MEINKRLFEDVLSGKLKGTFVSRDRHKYDSSNLRRNTNKKRSHAYPYALYIGNYTFVCYTTNGKISTCLEYNSDIIDFIPDTDMKENELTIEIPEGKIVDWDESKKQNKIVLKDKQLTYKDVCEKLFEKMVYFIDKCGKICLYGPANVTDPNNAPTEHQLECILAKNKLANVAVYLNNGWKPSKGDHVFTITYYGDFKDKLIISEHYFGTGENLVLFQTQKDAKQAIEILGEETVKLALDPLGI